MKNHRQPAQRRNGPLAKIIFIAIAGLFIPPTLLVYGVTELMNGAAE